MSRYALVLVAVLGGCLIPKQGPQSGVVPSGEPLAVVDDVKVWTTTYKEKVAEAEYRDDTGKKVGSAAIYEDRTQVHTAKIWYPVQGSQQLADEDFFRIAGDKQSLDETLQMRENGRKWRTRGYITMGASIVALVAGYFIDIVPVRVGLSIAGAVGLGSGYYMAFWGAHQLNPETHAVDRSVADRAARQYNQNLGQIGGVSVNKQF